MDTRPAAQGVEVDRSAGLIPALGLSHAAYALLVRHQCGAPLKLAIHQSYRDNLADALWHLRELCRAADVNFKELTELAAKRNGGDFGDMLKRAKDNADAT